MKCEKILVNILVTVIIYLSLCEARGGRRGGSFGGLFGGWRKYKKPSNGGGSSRRIVSSSPVHTPITKAWHENKKPSNRETFYKNINVNNNNMKRLPKGGSYYENTAALPGNAIYVAQPPPRGAEFGDFLTGYLAGRLLTMGFSTPHYRVTNIYREDPPIGESASASSTHSQVIILNNQQRLNSEEVEITTLTDSSTTTDSYRSEDTTSTTTTPVSSSTTEPPVPPFGVICVPIVINETNEKGEVVQNERTICYPVPPPPAPQKDMKSKPVEIAGDIVEH